MPTESILTFIEGFAPEFVALVLLVAALRIARELVPVQLPFGRLLRLLRPVAMIAAVVFVILRTLAALQTLPTPPVGWLAAGWLVASLPVYVIWRWWRGAEARETWARRIEQARGNERRRAPLPLAGNAGGSPAHGHAGANPPQGTP